MYLHQDRVCMKTHHHCLYFLSVKAVHLEPVTELTTSSFIVTLRRFIARREMPATIWSDNGTNCLKCPIIAHIEAFKASTGSSRQSMTLTTSGAITGQTSWNVWLLLTSRHPPEVCVGACPSLLWFMGGLCYKSFKQHLRRVVSEANLTYKELAVMWTQIEACLKSELTPFLEDSEGTEVLPFPHWKANNIV